MDLSGNARMYDSHNDCGLMPPMSRASLTIVSSAACVMVKCGEECNDSSGRTFRSRVNWTYSDVPSSLTTPDPIDLRCVSLNSTSSDDDSNSCSNNSNSNNLGRCASRNAGRASSDMCRCCTDTCYDEDAISLFYELQLENPQSKKVYRRQSSEELVAISDLFNEEPINARVVAKTIPTNKPFPLPPIPIASNYTFSGRKVLRNIRSCDVGRQGSLAIVGELLRHINDHLSGFKERKRRFSNWDSDNGSTSSFSSSFSNMNISVQKFTANQLDLKSLAELNRHVRGQVEAIQKLNGQLIQLLRLRERLRHRQAQHFQFVTTILQAASPKRRVDTKMRFSLEPFPGDNGFTQWRDAMKMVARLPGGIPTEFRRQLWLTLADRYIVYRQLDWPATCRSCLNERTNPDDDALGVQIVKDLHRTGCSHLTGDNEAAEQNQALLKRVLLAYARFNKHVGYCQGFNLLAALVLQVVEWNEEDALKMMLYLIEGVLPDGYFANDLRGLSVDMAVFRDLLRLRLAALAKHLDKLQLEANDGTAGNNTSSYEPPLTNVFTMQWFLTLFSTCLPPTSVLRVWDLTLLEGNEVLLRTALAIWDGLADRIMAVDSADEFYSIMGVLTREMLEFGLMDCNELVQTIVSMASFPFPQLQELREKYTFDIRPFAHNTTSAHRKSSIRNLVGLRLFDTEEDDDGELDEDQLALASAAWYLNQRHGKANVTLDINTLKRQYAKLRDRQRQAHVILTSTLKTAIEQQAHPDNARSQQRPLGRTRLPVNSLLAGHKPIVRKIRPTSKVQFTMPPDEVTRETNRPRGPRAMRTKIMIDERTDIAKQHQQPQTQHQQQKFSAQGTSPQRGETLTWEQIEREQREKFGSDRVRTRSWSSSTDDSSTTSLCDQSLHDLEGDSSSLCVSPILPASPRSPRLVQSTEIGSSVYQTPATGGCSTSPTVATPHSTDKKASSSSTGDSPLTETKDSAMHAQDPKQEQPEKIERQNRFVDQPKKALPPDRKPARQAGVNAVEIGLHSYSTLPSIQYASKDTDDRKLSCRSKMPPETEISAKDEVVVAVAMATQCRPHVVKLPLDSLSKQETIIGKSTPLEVSLSSNTEPIADVGLEETVNRGSSPNKVLPSSGNNGGSSNKTPASDSLRKLIIADAPQSWVTLSEKEDSPSAIVAGPGMWHQIPEGSFVGDGETDSVQVIHSQNASSALGVHIKEEPGTPPSLDELLKRYTKVTHLVEDASARLVASTSIDSGDSRTPPSRAESPPVVSFSSFPTQRTSALDNQVAHRLEWYSDH